MKKVKIFSIIILSLFALITFVNAEEEEKVCTEYTNYYFFNEINDLETVENLVKGQTYEHGDHRYHVTYYPALEGEKKSEGRVCLSKNNVVDGQNCLETWTLNKYYDTYVRLIKNGTVVSNFVDLTGNATSYTKLYNSSEKTSYFMHGYWFEKENGVVGTQGKGVVDITNVPTATLVAGSFLPTSTTLIFDYTGNATSTAIFAEVGRIIKVLDYRKLKEGKTEADIDLNNLDASTTLNITPFSLDWGDGTVHAKSTLTPALYKVVYQKCEKAYKATINYYYYKDGKTTDERIKLDDGTIKAPYSKDKLINGYTEPVTSPTLKNCTIVGTNGKRKDADKTVNVVIDSEDFNYNVYYNCDTYKATIDYYYYKDGKPTTDRVVFDNKEKNPFTKEGYLPGDTEKVNSPEKEGCIIVDTKGNKYDKDKVVNVIIDEENPKDFTKEVYYYCPPVNNPKTGDALIYLAWAIGLGAIGYSVYYFKKMKKGEV